MSASETPRTNAQERTTLNPADLLDLCRQLERELTAANAKLAEYASVEVPEEPLTGGLSTLDALDAYVTAFRKLATAYRAQSVRLREAERDAGYLWHALKDLSFDCDGVTRTQAPQRGTYNATFAVIEKYADKYHKSERYEDAARGGQ